jgi:hypothetical protein
MCAVAGLTLAAVTLGGCTLGRTDFVDEITPTYADLHGTVVSNRDVTGTYWFETRRQGTQDWYPWLSRTIDYTDGDQLAVSDRVAFSEADTDYEFRVCSKDSDATAAPGCGAVLSVRTLPAPQLTVTPDAGLAHAGQAVTVSGTGYPPDRVIAVDECGEGFCAGGAGDANQNYAHTDENGTFTMTFVPAFEMLLNEGTEYEVLYSCAPDDCYIRAFNHPPHLAEWTATAPISFADEP